MGRTSRVVRVRLIVLTALVLAAVVRPAAAEWRDDTDTPPWARRGALRWVQTGAPDAKAAQSLIDQGMNLLWGDYGTTDPKLIDMLRAGGVHRTTYICSTSIFWEPSDKANVFNRFPALKEAAALRADGGRLVIYDNPWDRDGAARRFAACRLSPEWMTYQQNRMTFAARGGQPFPGDPIYRQMKGDPATPLDAYFLDNPFAVQCYCTRCQDAWRKVCAARFGTFIPDPTRSTDPAVRAAWDFFWLDLNADYFARLKAFAHGMERPRLIAPNWTFGYPENYYMMERAQPDIVLVELGGGGERPWGRSEFAYKLAMAATHGKAVANIWCFPAARPRLDLSRRDRPLLWSNAIPSAYLTAAEAAACLSTYLSTGPEAFNRFLKEHRPLYAEAQQAAPVALVYSIHTELWRRRTWHVDEVSFLGPHWWIGMDQTPEGHAKHLADKLTRLGVPYDVLVESDLTPEQLKRYACVILPDVQCLEDGQAAALERYVRDGGRLLVGEQLATRDAEGMEVALAARTGARGEIGTLRRSVALVPARDMALVGFAPEGDTGRIAAPLALPGKNEPVRATATWTVKTPVVTEETGPWRVKVLAYESSLGDSELRLTVNGAPGATWKLDRRSDDFRWLVTEALTLHAGDALALENRGPAGLARVQEVRLEKLGAALALDKGSVVFEPDALAELPDGQLLDRLGQAGAVGTGFQTASPDDDVFVNFLRPAGRDVLALHILNATIHDHHAATVLDHPACLATRRVTLTAAERAALKAPVVSLQGFTPYWMQTYMGRTVAGQPYLDKSQVKAWLVVSVNGKEVGRLLLGTIADGWVDVPIDPALLAESNTITARVEGDVGFGRSYYGILIDARVDGNDSTWQPAPWADHQPAAANDLSPYQGVQSGSYMMVIRDRADAKAAPPYAPVHAPVEGLRIRVGQDLGATPAAALISPDEPGVIRLEVARGAEGCEVVVPKVDVYSVLLLGRSRQEIDDALAAR